MVAAVKAAIEHHGPVYIRLGRLAVESFNNSVDYRFELGKGITLKDGKDITIIATGLMVSRALEAVKSLADQGIDARLINIHTIKPIDREIVLKAARETGKIITVEEHNVIGGLGDAVCSVLCEELPTPVYKIGVNDVYGHSGPAADLLDEFGLNAANIIEVTKKVLKK
jgi:transketolase